MKRAEISFVIPAKNEEESLPILISEIKIVMSKIKKSNFEIILIDDGSTDQTFKVMKNLFKKNGNIKVIQLRGNHGKSIALQTGFQNTTGKIVFTLDADLQDNPKQIPDFLKKLNEGFDLVSGWKKIRHDPSSKVIPSRILNKVTSLITGVKIHDINCGYKAYKREVIENLVLYGELYRFIPIIAAKQNFKVTEIVVEHRGRIYGKTKFGIERNLKGLLDLLTIIFLTGYLRRPGHFFGTLGLLSFGIGFLIGLYISYLRLTTGSIQYRHPLLFLGMLLMIVGVQLISTGLVTEMFTYFNPKKDLSSNYLNKLDYSKK